MIARRDFLRVREATTTLQAGNAQDNVYERKTKRVGTSFFLNFFFEGKQ